MSEAEEAIERMVPDLARILAHLEEERKKGRYLALTGPEARALVSGYDAVFLAEAEAAAVRSAAAKAADDPRGEAGGAAAAILCAAAACEASLSEYLAKLELTRHGLPATLENVRGERDAAKQWKLLLKEFSPLYDFGASKEYRGLGCLVQLRDLVAHRNARTLPLGSFPTSLSDCVRQKVIPILPKADADWTSLLFTAPVAQWAFQAARDWLNTAARELPDPTVR